jgi:elongation factor P
MAGIQATRLRRGMAIFFEDKPWRVMEFEHRTPGNLPAFVQTKLRNLLDGTQRQQKFMASEFVERAVTDTREMEFLYADADGYHFMDTQTYDQLAVPEESLGDAAVWLSDGMRVEVQLLDGNPIGVELPKSIEIEVAEAEPVIKGQTAAKSSKPAKLRNGVSIQVPPFVKAGDRIRVDPEERRYIERVKS